MARRTSLGHILPHLLLLASLAALGALGVLAWQGRLGLPAAALLAVSGAAYFSGRRGFERPARDRLDLWAKALFTAAGILALLRHPIDAGEGIRVPIHSAITSYLSKVEPGPFAAFALIAMAVKLAGVAASAAGWHLLLIGQGIRFPFWQTTMTSFLIGRFIGTFLPSTIGLDGYTLFEASRYSNQWQRAVTAKALEKIVGVAGLFLSMVLTLPFGYAVIEDVMAGAGRPDRAPLLAVLIAVIAGGISLSVLIALARPWLLTRLVALAGGFLPGGMRGQVETFERAVGAYHGQLGLLLAALLAKFASHFATAAVYYFTALAIGVVGAGFWPIVFGSTIQILATVLSPTIAGEGAREAFQALLLSRHLGGVAQAVLSGALGFLAAEAATLWGGAFLWSRKPGWRPRFALVDGTQVDYSWIRDESQTTKPRSPGSPALA